MVESLATSSRYQGSLGWPIIFVWIGLALGCAATSETTKPAGEEDRFAVSFAYKGFGAGPQPLLGLVELSEGNEAKVVSRALLEAMQRFQLSVVDPPAQLDTLLPPDKTWKTDVAPVQTEVVQEYNRLFPQLGLPVDRLYGIQYSGTYSVVMNELRFRIESVLYQRGSGSDYRPFSRKDYAGSFFFERLKALIIDRLRAASGSGIPQ